MIFDTHMHCEFSCDSHMKLTDAVSVAAGLGIGAVITEHWDYDYPTNPQAFLFDLDAYFRRFAPLRNAGFLIGIEIGMQKHTAEADDKVAARHDFDFVLGSIHCMNRRDIYEPVCYTGKSRLEAVREFLTDAVACVENHDNFDSFAHIDYMCRYWPYEEKNLFLQDAPELFDKLFAALIAKGKAIEINTRRLDDEQAAQALLPLYCRYKELGGRYCTLGSDAHYAEHIGRRLDVALEMARQAGLTPVYFEKRKLRVMEDVKI